VDLRLVAYFVAVADHGSITRAARALYIAQPSLSQAIRNLEGQLGVQLFDRAGRTLRLTPDGAALLEDARQIMADVDNAKAKVHAVRDRAGGRLDIAALATLSVDPLPGLANELRREFPRIQLNIFDPGGSAAVVNAVRHGTAELGLTDLPCRSETLHSVELGSQEIALVLPPDLAAELPDPVPLPAVAQVPLVIETADTRSLPDELLDAVTGCVAVECAHRAAISELVQHGAGAAFLPRKVAETELTGVVVRSMVPEMRRSIGVVFRPGPLSPAAAAFLETGESLHPPASELDERLPSR
jgi:DNA-binding transcriptional LysR family regulator